MGGDLAIIISILEMRKQTLGTYPRLYPVSDKHEIQF